ncbi:hypothetical protein MD484_g1186, partial [Candolleomyces efflorescens]
MVLATNARELLSSGRRDLVFVSIIAVLSSFAQAPTSTILPTILTLSALHTYARVLFPSVTAKRGASLLLGGITVGGAVPNVAASLEALSAGPQSFFLLFLLSAITSTIVIVGIYVEWALSRQIISPLGRILLLPAIWSTIWCTVPYLSPVGHLLTWSRGATLGGYGWLIPVLGTSGQDWIAAGWAVVLSEVFQTWYMGPVEDDDSEGSESQPAHSNAHAYTPALAAFLLLLIIPSYFVGNVLPMPVGNVDEATTFGVGCINPTFQRYKHRQPNLKDFIDETKKYQNRAKFLLWPEGAVTFDSDAERDAAFETVRLNISGAYVGLSFEQYVPDPNDKFGRKSLKKTGIAVIGKDDKEPYLTYYKRHLVPGIAAMAPKRARHYAQDPYAPEIPGKHLHPERSEWLWWCNCAGNCFSRMTEVSRATYYRHNPHEDSVAHARQRKRPRTNNQSTPVSSNSQAGPSGSSEQAAQGSGQHGNPDDAEPGPDAQKANRKSFKHI